MYDTWWERSGLTKEQAEDVLQIAYRLNIAGIGDHIDSLISVIAQYAPQPRIMDTMFLYDKDKVINRVNEQIRRSWSDR